MADGSRKLEHYTKNSSNWPQEANYLKSFKLVYLANFDLKLKENRWPIAGPPIPFVD